MRRRESAAASEYSLGLGDGFVASLPFHNNGRRIFRSTPRASSAVVCRVGLRLAADFHTPPSALPLCLPSYAFRVSVPEYSSVLLPAPTPSLFPRKVQIFERAETMGDLLTRLTVARKRYDKSNGPCNVVLLRFGMLFPG